MFTGPRVWRSAIRNLWSSANQGRAGRRSRARRKPEAFRLGGAAEVQVLEARALLSAAIHRASSAQVQTQQAAPITSGFNVGWADNFLFTTAAGNPAGARTDGIAIDSAGNTTIGFDTVGTGNLDPAQSAAGAYQNTQYVRGTGLVQYDAAGNFRWMTPIIPTSGISYIRALTVGSSSGDIYVVGDVTGPCTLTTTAGTSFTFGSTSVRTAYMARFDAATGHLVWMDSAVGGIFTSVACDAAENVYVLGSLTSNTATFNSAYGGTTGFPVVVNNPTPNATSKIIMKCNTNGNAQWDDVCPATSVGYLSVDGSGNVFLTGSFSGTYDFNFGPATYNLTAIGSADAFLEKLDANGNFVWAKQLGARRQTYFGGPPVADTNGNVDFTIFGSSSTTVTLQTGKRSQLTGNLWQFDTNGNPLWAASVPDGTTNFPVNQSISLNGANDIYLPLWGVFYEYTPSGTQVQNVPFHAGVSFDFGATAADGTFVFGGSAVDGTGSTNAIGQADVSPTSTPHYVPAWTGGGYSSVLIVRWNRQ